MQDSSIRVVNRVSYARTFADVPAAAVRNILAARIQVQTIISLINPVGLARRLIIRYDVKATFSRYTDTLTDRLFSTLGSYRS